jgi:two-component system sensor histidine kinase HydH
MGLDMTEGPARRKPPVRLPALSLRGKLLLFAAGLLILPGLLFGALAQQSARASLKRVIGRQLAREAGYTAEALAAALDAERRAVGSFAHQDVMREIRVADIDKRIASALATLRNGNVVRLDYFVVDRAQRVVAASRPRLIGPLPPWVDGIDRVLAGEERLVGPMTVPAYRGRVLLLATPVSDPDGGDEAIGALVGVYDWQGLAAVTRNVRRDLLRVGLSTRVFVVRTDGTVLAATPALLPREMPPAGWPDVAHSRGQTPPDYVVEPRAGLLIGRGALGAALPDWRLLIVEPLADALAPARRLAVRLAAALAVTLALALSVAAVAAQRVARPLSELTRAIRSLGRGEAATLRVAVPAQDEVGALASAFNRMATELDQAQRDLVDAAKFAFAGELAAGVAHEVRTSLGVLRSSAQMLERSLPAGTERNGAELAQLLVEEVDRLSRVVDDLLSLSRPRPLQLQDTPISLPVFRAVEFVEPQARAAGVEIQRRLPAVDPVALCDVELIRQVALNLLVNAVQALPAGGSITVRILGEGDGYVGFEVEDDGPGIPEPLRAKVFLPFVTGRDGGVGLGLTFVQRVVHEHHGRLSLKTAAGAGACFRVELPAAEGQA